MQRRCAVRACLSSLHPTFRRTRRAWACRIAAAILLLLSTRHSPAQQTPRTIRVPQDFPTIGTGIVAAQDGDTVLDGPGVYRENISFQSRAVILVSEAGPEQTIIDGGKA